MIGVEAMKFKPPLRGVMEAAFGSGLRSVSTSVTVIYDQLGNVIAVKLDKPTGVKSLDRAIRAWAAKIKLQTDEAGSGSIPIVMSVSE